MISLLEVGTSFSNKAGHPELVARELVDDALAQLREYKCPKFALLLVSRPGDEYDALVSAVCDRLKEETQGQDVPLIGCTCVFCLSAKAEENGISLQVWASPEIVVQEMGITEPLTDWASCEREVGKLANKLQGEPRGHLTDRGFVIAFTPGLWAPADSEHKLYFEHEIQGLLNQALDYRIPITGGAALDPDFSVPPRSGGAESGLAEREPGMVFLGREVRKGSVAALRVRTDLRFGIGLRHPFALEGPDVHVETAIGERYGPGPFGERGNRATKLERVTTTGTTPDGSVSETPWQVYQAICEEMERDSDAPLRVLFARRLEEGSDFLTFPFRRESDDSVTLTRRVPPRVYMRAVAAAMEDVWEAADQASEQAIKRAGMGPDGNGEEPSAMLFFLRGLLRIPCRSQPGGVQSRHRGVRRKAQREAHGFRRVLGRRKGR